jgi:hypothetical protein
VPNALAMGELVRDLASKKAERPELRILLNKHRLPTK